MKNRLLTDTLRTIKKSIGRYLTLLFIVFLGVSFFAGMLSISAAMGESVDGYADEYNLMDFQLYSNYGFDEEDIAAINNFDNSFIAEGGHMIDVEATFGDTNYIFRVESYNEENKLNRLKLVEGRLPEAPNEAVAEVPSNLFVVPKIGDTITVERGTQNPDEALQHTEIVIVGVVETPHYLSQEKGNSTLDNLALDSYLYLPQDAFTADFFTTVYIQSTDAVKLSSFSTAYSEQIEADEVKLDELATEQQTRRADEIKQEALKEYEDGLAEYNDGLAAFEDEIASAEQELKTALAEIENAQAQLTAIDVSTPEIDAQLAILAENQSSLQAAMLELETDKKETRAQFDEAALDLADARQSIDELLDGEWTILSREMHYPMATYTDTVNQMQVIGLIFPIFFFLVAALVCLTTMTRMVDDRRGEVGLLRALGYSRLACAGKYLAYALTATLIGGVLGSIAGLLIFPPIIYSTWQMLYNLPPLSYATPWQNMFIAIGSFLILMGLVTFSAIRAETSEVVSALMRPKSPPPGKKIFLEKAPMLWQRCSFTTKVTARNIIRYKKRFIMTVIGIAGCTCLLVSGFGMRGSIGGIATIQYDELTLYDATVTTTEDISQDDFEQLVNDISLAGQLSNATGITSYATNTASDTDEQIAFMQVYNDDEELKQINVVRSRTDAQELLLDDKSVLISEKLSELLSVSVGDEITIEGQNAQQATVIISGIFEKYINHEIYISDSYYNELFTEPPIDNVIQLGGIINEERLKDEVLTLPDVSGITFNSEISDSLANITNSMDIVVAVIIISAAALAFVVLGNLAAINISERKREIATLKVLGFNNGETKDYIFKENMVLTIFGSIFGVILGIFSHYFIIIMVEMNFLMFNRTISIDSIIYSVFLTFVFSILVNKVMLSRIKKIDMIESLKSVE